MEGIYMHKEYFRYFMYTAYTTSIDVISRKYNILMQV